MIRHYLESKGYALPSAAWYGQLEQWLAWYKGYVPEVHRYRMYRPSGQSREAERYRLGMAKVVCEDYASLLLNEHVQIACDGFPANGARRGDALGALLEANDFYTRANRLTELTMALGTGAFVEYPDARGVPVIDYIRGDRIYPLTWDGERVLECAFASRKTLLVGAHRVRGYYLQVHLQEGDQWRIRNIYLDEHGGEIPAPEGIRPVSERSPIPLFQIVRPNTTNCVDLDNPMGMSVFGTAVEQLKACDIVYDSYVTEFVLGKKRLMVPETLAQAMINASGTVDLRFDPADELIYVYPQAEDGKDGIKEIDLHLRATEHEQALQRQMDLICKKCGLGVGRYRIDAGASANKTATEVISSKSDLYQSLKRHEKTFETAIVGMVQALCWLSGGKADAEVQVAFDDSIIEDVNATIQRNTLLVNSGLRSKVDAIMAIEQCEESVAKRKLAAIQAENGLGAELGGEMGGEAVPDSLTAQTVESGIGKTLNGAQTQALVGILTQYTQGQITLGQAIKVISISIGVTEAEAKAILEGIASGGEA